ncbi:MAG: regulatory helix-turn-helix protein, lysR family [Rhodobacteraceae bacterium HLUCCA24]|nr:MAG: regulatory helix-turn-helix protein, lysR family [Rhodobacteraceae bacterium HLUCCA24]
METGDSAMLSPDAARLVHRLKLRQLQLIIAVGEQGSILNAARDLDMAQPSATKLIKDLEAAFAVPLFERTNRGVVPTMFGQALIRHGKLILSQVTHAAEELADLADGSGGRVVVGTLAVTRPDLVKQAAKYHPDAVVLAVDVWQGTVTSHGWREASAFVPADFIAQFEGEPLAAIMVTDITADIDGVEEPLALVTELAGVARTPVIASGLVHSLDDIARLKYVPGVWGAVVGRPLLARDFTLEEALAMAAEPRGETAEFI